MANVMWVFYASKLLEFGDTVRIRIVSIFPLKCRKVSRYLSK